jgi:hypothetical protein
MKHEIIYGYFCTGCLSVFAFIFILIIVGSLFFVNDKYTKSISDRIDLRVSLSYLFIIFLFAGLLLFI